MVCENGNLGEYKTLERERMRGNERERREEGLGVREGREGGRGRVARVSIRRRD